MDHIPDREEIVEGLKKVWNAFNAMEHELYADYVFEALELLMPVEPEKLTVVDYGEFANAAYLCGACKMSIERVDTYCKHCGKKVKWDAAQ